MVERAESVRNPVLAAVADEQQMRIPERAPHWAHSDRRREVGRSSSWPGLPVRALDRPRHDVLEAAEDSAAVARRLASAEAVVRPRPRLRTRCTLSAAGPLGRFSADARTRPALSSSRATRPARSCSTRRCACSIRTSAGVELDLEHYDLSLENRRTTGNEVVVSAARGDARGRLRRSRRRRSRPRAPTTSAARTGSSARRSTAR